MNLYFVRHAEAKPLGGPVTTDAARPLTADGERDARIMGRMLSRLEPHVPMIAYSPLLRAARTASLLSEGFKVRPAAETWNELTPGVHANELLARVNAVSAHALVLVGHQPDMTNLLALLVADAAAEIALPPGAIACVTLNPGLTQSVGRMHWLLTPELVRALSPGL
jgi:phosphohistidine phosphatase